MKRNQLTRIVSAVAVVCFICILHAGIVNAQQIYCTTDDGLSLASIDPATAYSTVVGPFGNLAMGLAVDNFDGTLYTIVDSCLGGCNWPTQQLAVVDPLTGQTTRIGQPISTWALVSSAIPALEVGNDGYVYAGGTNGYFYRIDKTTGQAVLLGTGSVDMVMDYAFDGSGRLWAVAGLQNDIYTIDLATGQATFEKRISGVTSVGSGIMGIMFDKDDTMYATNIAPYPDAHLYRVDTDAAVATDLGILNLSQPHGGDILIAIKTCVAPPAGLLAWWTGNGTAADQTGTYDGTLIGGASYARGRAGQGFALDGVNAYVNAGTSDTFNFNSGMGDLSIAALVKVAGYSQQGNNIVSKGDASPDNGWSLHVTPEGALELTGNGLYALTSPAGTITPAIWAHVALVKSGSTAALYKNGVQVASMEYGDLQTSFEPLALGLGLYGTLDEVQIFNRALSSSEIYSIYDVGGVGLCMIEFPDLSVSSLGGPASGTAGQSVSVSDTTRNNGRGASGASTTRYYWSADNEYGSGDVELGSRAVPSLASGASSSGSVSLAIPSGAAPGTYYIIARADADGAVTETNEGNNSASLAFTVAAAGTVDFTSGTNLPSTANVAAGSTVTFAVYTKNWGTGTAGPSVTRLYLSTDSTYGSGDVELGSVSVPSLGPGVYNATSKTVTIPAGTPSGAYYLISRADADGAVAESNETNNDRPHPFTVTP
ncbi:MAG: hypothetical protein HY896_02270 [Deltaproteobacteria bacterium]|nr:hypothetical protein [Deltaproteobacteria bacterium]